MKPGNETTLNNNGNLSLGETTLINPIFADSNLEHGHRIIFKHKAIKRNGLCVKIRGLKKRKKEKQLYDWLRVEPDKVYITGGSVSTKDKKKLDSIKSDIELLVSDYNSFNKELEKLNNVFSTAFDSPLIASVWKQFENRVDLIARIHGDKAGWISWFIYENECGLRELEAGERDNLKPIKSIDDLISLFVHS